jgi:hypothetical protein
MQEYKNSNKSNENKHKSISKSDSGFSFENGEEIFEV